MPPGPVLRAGDDFEAEVEGVGATRRGFAAAAEGEVSGRVFDSARCPGVLGTALRCVPHMANIETAAIEPKISPRPITKRREVNWRAAGAGR
jgi:hypothetical protein